MRFKVMVDSSVTNTTMNAGYWDDIIPAKYVARALRRMSGRNMHAHVMEITEMHPHGRIVFSTIEDEPVPCKRCHGTGHQSANVVCYVCNGVGTHHATNP